MQCITYYEFMKISYIEEHMPETLHDRSFRRGLNSFFPPSNVVWSLSTSVINQLSNFAAVVLNYLTSKIALLASRNFVNCNGCTFDEGSPMLHRQFSRLRIYITLV